MIHHNGTANSLDYAERYQDAQVEQASDERREMREERFGVPDPNAEAWQAELNRLDAILGDIGEEKRAVGQMMRRLIICRDSYHPDFDKTVAIENAQIHGMCEWLLRTLRPRMANLREQHEAARQAWLKCLGNKSKFGKGVWNE